jgi:hypothetical protein
MGKKTFANGDVYIGAFYNNFMYGKGCMKYKNGEVFQGEFKMDRREGKGKLILVDKSYIEGVWVNNELKGQITTFSKKGKFLKTETVNN